MSSGSTRPPSLNDGTNLDAARPATPTISTHEGEPSMTQILAALVNTQALLANTLSRGPPTTSLIQIHSRSDTSSSIPLFDGTPQQSAHEWITQVERIAALAHWTPSLTLVTAASRLAGSAKDWHSAYGSQYDTWKQWKEALILRFKRKLTMQEFLELQTKRRLQSHETIVEYMYSKNAIPNKAPYRLAEEERISLILSGIEDDTWANPLAAQLCGTVTELIDRAALLDARRRTTVCAENNKKPSSSIASRGQGSNQRVPASSSANLPKANPRSDFSGAPHPRPISARSCFNCGDIGHLSLPVEPCGKFSSSEVPPLKQGTPHRGNAYCDVLPAIGRECFQRRRHCVGPAQPEGWVGSGKESLDRAWGGLGLAIFRPGSGSGLSQARISPGFYTYRCNGVDMLLYLVLCGLT
ncbi:hypothetical protein HPB51_007613 [Rhipicephalus microplus]|uniref:Retrotransposon gag domain-containing protein n=1 Tax=Rhipicephalus microplus TaxID=6941 RepID=A0A9J6D4E0_RHIMP|nr:hypothetical protein HPB51_007613 [Rhipicephalus microplus]